MRGQGTVTRDLGPYKGREERREGRGGRARHAYAAFPRSLCDVDRRIGSNGEVRRNGGMNGEGGDSDAHVRENGGVRSAANSGNKIKVVTRLRSRSAAGARWLWVSQSQPLPVSFAKRTGCGSAGDAFLARIIHDRFCCNRLPVRVRTQTGRSADTYFVAPHSSLVSRRSRDTHQEERALGRFRNEPP